MPLEIVKQNTLESPHIWRARLILCVVVGGLLFLLCFFSAKRAGASPLRYGNDFTVFYTAALSMRETGDPYHHPLIEHWPYLYPPLLAQLLVPVTYLSLPTAAFLWSVGNLLSVAGTLWLCEQTLLSHFSHRHLWVFRIGWLLLVERLITGNLFLGQVNLWIAFLLTCLICFERLPERIPWAGLALAVAISIKLTPVVFLLYLLARRSWKTLAWTCGWGIILNALSLVFLGSKALQLVQEWFTLVVVHGWKFNWATGNNQSLRGALERFLAHGRTDFARFPDVTVFSYPEGVVWIWRILVIIVAGGVVWMGWQSKKRGAPRQIEDWAASGTCCACLLVSNLSWIVHFALLMFPVACLLREVLEKQTGKPSGFALGILLLMLMSLGAGTYLLPGVAQDWMAVHSVITGGTLIVFSYCMFQMLMKSSQTKNGEILYA